MDSVDCSFAGRNFRMVRSGPKDQAAEEIQRGVFEEPLPILVMAVLARLPGAVIDVGANSGVYSVLGACVAPGVRVIAFEPYPPALQILRANVAINGLEERVAVHPVALSDCSGEATLHVPDQSHGLLETSSSLNADFRQSASTIRVDGWRLDDLEIAGPVAAMKIDVEGHEPAVLRGAEALLARDRPVLFVEVLSVADIPSLQGFVDQYDCAAFRIRRDVCLRQTRVEHDPRAWNWAFVPRERLGIFEAACRAHHIAIAAAIA